MHRLALFLNLFLGGVSTCPSTYIPGLANSGCWTFDPSTSPELKITAGDENLDCPLIVTFCDFRKFFDNYFFNN